MARIKKVLYDPSFTRLEEQAGAQRENNDCAVKAVAIATRQPYEAVLDLMTKNGRRPRKGTPIWVTDKTIDQLGYRMLKLDPKSFIAKYPSPHFNLKSVTTHHPRRFPNAWPKDRVFLLRTRRHILAVIDGRVIDYTINMVKRVVEVYEVKRKDETQAATDQG